jgi:hypothetical protein
MLPDWLQEKSMWAQLGIINRCTKMMASRAFFSNVHKRVSLFEVREAIADYKANMTAGKYIIYPQQEAPASVEGSREVKEEEKKELE